MLGTGHSLLCQSYPCNTDFVAGRHKIICLAYPVRTPFRPLAESISKPAWGGAVVFVTEMVKYHFNPLPSPRKNKCQVATGSRDTRQLAKDTVILDLYATEQNPRTC